MLAKPSDWDVVVVGAWNRAILTPEGIQRRLFLEGAGTPLQVEVSIDRPAPFRVVIQGMTVIAATDRLIVSPVATEYPALTRAAEVAARAIEALPETPLVAAGMNVRFVVESLPGQLLEKTKAPIDKSLADEGFLITHWMHRRALKRDPGLINIEIHHSADASGEVSINFHRTSADKNELLEWLRSASGIEPQVERLLAKVLNLSSETYD
jgi:hypothetical protein